MWIVAFVWNDYEQEVFEFCDEDKAKEFYESRKDDTNATVYLAKVEKKKEPAN